MGNLRQKYTEEEWEELGKKVKENAHNNWKKRMEEIELVSKVEKLVKQTPNDQELGKKIRELIKFGSIMGI